MMNKYTLYCTPEQTKKALALGAPIEYKNEVYYQNGAAYPVPPTAEQMVGWLEEQNTIRNISITTYGFTIWTSDIDYITEKHIKRTRQEATIAAIDAALDYLSKNKK